ncbi:zinc finger, CCHC-type containing protein [Tanacetum coccineum]|uniref:Zinc finger, CCHC-type containing protein n=1 Tax=Tanacetum coccineum TaxID=301880 RepID=A0ABQ4WWU9_9ASTR
MMGMMQQWSKSGKGTNGRMMTMCVMVSFLMKYFKHTLKHKKKELNLVEFGNHLRIEESLKVQASDKPKRNNVAGPSVVNMVEHNNFIRYNDNKGKPKHQDTKADPNKKSKVICWKCGKPRHLKRDCKGGKVANKPMVQAQMDDDVACYYRAIGERLRKERVLEHKRRSSRKSTKSEEYDVSF